MRWSQQTDYRPTRFEGAPVSVRHPDVFAVIMDTPEYLTGVEVCRQDDAERDPKGCPSPWLAASMQPWGRQSAARGLAEDYLNHLARTGERAANPVETAQFAYCTEQFVKRFFVEGARVVEEASPSFGTDLPNKPIGEMGSGRRCTYVSFSTPQESPWPGHPYIGGYLDPNLGFDDPLEPDAGILLVTRLPPTGAATGFWPLYRDLNRTVAVWGQSDTLCGDLVKCLADTPGTGPASSPQTARAVVRLLRTLHLSTRRESSLAA